MNEALLQTILKEIQSVKSEVQSIKSDLQSVKSELQTVKSDLKSVKSELHTVKSDLKSVKSDLQAVKTQTDENTQLLKAIINRQEERNEETSTSRRPTYSLFSEMLEKALERLPEEH